METLDPSNLEFSNFNGKLFGHFCFIKSYSGASIERSAKELVKYVRYNEVSLYRGSFPFFLLLLAQDISFVIPRTSLNRGSLNRDSTVFSQRDFRQREDPETQTS